MAQRYASTTISNHTQGNLKRVLGDQFAPETIFQDNSILFATANSKGYVIYEGTNVQGGPSNCWWLLAWKVLGCDNQVCINLITSSPRS